LPNSHSTATEIEDVLPSTRYSFQIKKKTPLEEGGTPMEAANVEQEAPAHLAAVTEKAMKKGSKIGSRVALFEHINAGQVDEYEKERAADEAVKSNRRLSIKIQEMSHDSNQAAPEHFAAVTEKAIHTKIGSRVAMFEHLHTGHVDEEEKRRAADEAVKTNRRLSMQIRQENFMGVDQKYEEEK